jgi:hypothetical protein
MDGGEEEAMKNVGFWKSTPRRRRQPSSRGSYWASTCKCGKPECLSCDVYKIGGCLCKMSRAREEWTRVPFAREVRGGGQTAGDFDKAD